MALVVLVADGIPYLINDESPAADNVALNILKEYPDEALVEFRKPTPEDLAPNTYPKWKS